MTPEEAETILKAHNDTIILMTNRLARIELLVENIWVKLQAVEDFR